MLRRAWVEAGPVGERPALDPGAWDSWIESALSKTSLLTTEREQGAALLRETVRFALIGRFLSAAEMLRRFRSL
jgi:hypothetical protein